MNIDQFGEIMDKFIKDAPIQMLIQAPEGKDEFEVKDNTGMGPVMQFYIMLNAIKPIYEAMLELFDETVRSEGSEKLVDSLLDLIRKELLREEESA